ncbi:MAG: dihydrofolate synthase [Flaviaesturariibacter sp.]|nr:dihydrofolate synthase [Flaviaesturariibacter sp.]
MTYAETIDYLFKRLPLFSRIGSAAYKKDLTNTIALCESLGNPQQRLKTIHVGGTNGKGSVSHMLAAIFQSAGYKTGLYTSPHLYDFRERIKVNGEIIAEDFVIEFTKRIQPQIELLEPSFFEITVALAFDYFEKQEVDIAIIEVGLGGRLDSTNIITPELAVITNIGWDHMNMLGDSLTQIATEKAGIIKTGIPVVIGEHNSETDTIFDQTAKGKFAAIYYASDNFSVRTYKQSFDYLEIELQPTANQRTLELQLDLTGLYQLKNVCTVLQAIALLKAKGWKINDQYVVEGLKSAKKRTGLQGRWEVIQQCPTIVLEVAHNVDGIQQMLQQLSQGEYGQLHLVFGMVKDKEIDPVLKLLPKNATYYFSQAHIPRALPAADLAKAAKIFELYGNAYEDVNEALAAAKKTAAINDLIVVCGSIFLVAEVER